MNYGRKQVLFGSYLHGTSFCEYSDASTFFLEKYVDIKKWRKLFRIYVLDIKELRNQAALQKKDKDTE